MELMDNKRLRLERYYGNREAVQLLISWVKQNKRNSVPMETLQNALDSYNTTYNDYKREVENERKK